ncbi:MAG: asparagine synthase (glutamine-hydrolyzing) [Elusimicrobia bacterium]|nr:asparagine synthase (glutamine-hydrolyzing) [Elusimicrobiota bacterium]
MCGICGVYNLSGEPPDRGALGRMRSALAHRGPDDEGEHFEGGLGLGFRRLSILDLEAGHQPMSTPDKRLTIVFNGEIYNHLDLRRGLAESGVAFRTRSDTETLLHLYARHGTGAFRMLNGMFALAVWDASRRELVLARDPIGVKPLYWLHEGDRVVFSSELRSLLAGGFGRGWDHGGVLDYLAFAKAHAPRTVAAGIMKLRPAHFLTVNPSGVREERYWALPGRRPRTPPLKEAVESLDRILFEAVKGNTLSDVPVGTFLSGGVDSALVAALMTRHFGPGKVKTFSVGFSGAGRGVDESVHARKVAEHLGTDHHELILPQDVLSRLDESIGLLDEPIGDSAILPTFLLARFAREKVKVVLTGEGADELFGGYNRYKAAWLSGGLKSLPSWAAALAAPLARRLGKGRLFDLIPFADAAAWAQAQAHATPAELGEVLHPDWRPRLRPGAPDWAGGFDRMDDLNDALGFDLATVLPDALLMKADKSTMRASLEARVPFLDKPVVEFAASLPGSHKIRLFKGKYILRRVAERYLPADIVWRRKHGFIVPWESWVRSPDNALVRDLVYGRGFMEDGIFDASQVKQRYERLVQGDRGVDAGLFFRIVILGLWAESLKKEGVSL